MMSAWMYAVTGPVTCWPWNATASSGMVMFSAVSWVVTAIQATMPTTISAIPPMMPRTPTAFTPPRLLAGGSTAAAVSVAGVGLVAHGMLLANRCRRGDSR